MKIKKEGHKPLKEVWQFETHLVKLLSSSRLGKSLMVRTPSLIVFQSQSFHSHLMNMSEYFKLPDFNPDLLDIAMVKSYVSSMKREYISYWQNTL